MLDVALKIVIVIVIAGRRWNNVRIDSMNESRNQCYNRYAVFWNRKCFHDDGMTKQMIGT